METRLPLSKKRKFALKCLLFVNSWEEEDIEAVPSRHLQTAGRCPALCQNKQEVQPVRSFGELENSHVYTFCTYEYFRTRKSQDEIAKAYNTHTFVCVSTHAKWVH